MEDQSGCVNLLYGGRKDSQSVQMVAIRNSCDEHSAVCVSVLIPSSFMSRRTVFLHYLNSALFSGNTEKSESLELDVIANIKSYIGI